VLADIFPTPILILSADQDPYSQDADRLIELCQDKSNITHARYEGPHELTQERFNRIIAYVLERVSSCVR